MVPTTENEKVLSKMVKERGEQSLAGVNLRNEIANLLSFTGMTGDEMRDAIKCMVAEYDAAREATRAKYKAD